MFGMWVPFVALAFLALNLQGCYFTNDRDFMPTTAPPSPSPDGPSEGPFDPGDPSNPEANICSGSFMQGITCSGGDIAYFSADTPDECCNLCSQNPACRAFTHSDGQCKLKNTCEQLHKDWKNPNTASAVMANADIRIGWYEIDGYKCFGQKDTVVFYPAGTGPFRVVVFGHGSWGEIDGADAWMALVASEGLIVIAPFAGRADHGCGYMFADDMLLALTASKAGGEALHPVFAKADWSKTGLFGHSRGAKCGLWAASQAPADLHVSAVIASADAPAHAPPTAPVPAMFAIGSKDWINQDGNVRDFFDGYPAPSKVLANLKGAGHMEIVNHGRLNKFMAKFLSCHVNDRQNDCDVIYGQGEGSLCRAYEYEDCIVVPPAIAELVVG